MSAAMTRRPSSAIPLLLPALLVAACSTAPTSAVQALFDLGATGDADLYALPYPNNLRLLSDGSIDLARLADLKNIFGDSAPALLQSYMDLVAKNASSGFGLGSAVFFRFTGAIDKACLPTTPEESLLDGASVSLVNIDTASASYGKRTPVRLQFTEDEGKYIGANHLSVLPVAGTPLDPGTTYAAILTDAVCDPAGDSVEASSDFEKLLAETASDSSLESAHAAYQPLRDHLATSGLTGVISAAVFTTGTPSALAGRARKVLYKQAAPTAQSLQAYSESSTTYELRGTYKASNFEQGSPPYLTKGGEIKLDKNGDPVPAVTESLRFALTVPSSTRVPDKGWPLVIYAHGTGGDYRTFIYEGIAENLAEVLGDDGLAISRMAVAGIDQVLHGPRDPTGNSPDLTFFNIGNAAASVNNVIQAGIDDFSLLRMLLGIDTTSVPWAASSKQTGSVSFDPNPLRFDPDRIYFMGHSQGGLTGPVFLAHEPKVKAAILSGAGGGAALGLLYKTAPIAIQPLLELAFKDTLDEFHPMVSLLQQMLEPADTANYGRMLIERPPAGVKPKHIFLSQGLTDHYTPNATTDALATAIRVPIVTPVRRSISSLELLGEKPIAPPFCGNISASGMSVTAGLLQFKAVAFSPTQKCKIDTDCGASGGAYCDGGICRDDGHFVIFDDATAIRQYSRFLATHARDGAAVIGK
jgi:pimeloyl-ACP methyl ester carboxylesterase